jgi:single-stranded-DNA-specific exonuclease
MAAGLSIAAEQIPEFRRTLARTVRERCGRPERPPLEIDGYLDLGDLSLDLAEQVERLAPFGPGNRLLLLASRGLSAAGHTTLGRSGEHRQVIVKDEAGATQKVLWWRGGGEPLPEARFDLAYAVRAGGYRGRREVEVVWVDARPLKELAVVLRAEPAVYQVVDHRREPRPRELLDRLRAQGDVAVWAEAEARAEVGGLDRRELGPAGGLVVWTTPPGPAELRAALEAASPRQVFLVGQDPGLDDAERFLGRLAGLIKRALGDGEGRVSVSTLATATAQREATVRAGLAWLAARGHVAVQREVGDEVCLAAGSGAASVDLPRMAEWLRALLEETAAYRAHFARVEEGMVLSTAETQSTKRETRSRDRGADQQ